VEANENQFGRDIVIVIAATALLAVAAMLAVRFQGQRRNRSAMNAFRELSETLPDIFHNAADAAVRNDKTSFERSIGLAMETEIEMRDQTRDMDRTSRADANRTLQRVSVCEGRLSRFNQSLNGPYAVRARQLDPNLPQQVQDCSLFEIR
jgi:hypothetical protein